MSGKVESFEVRCNPEGDIYLKLREPEIRLTRGEARYLAGVLESMSQEIWEHEAD